MKTLTEFSALVLRNAQAARNAQVGAEGEALQEAVATALGVQPDRAARLLEALDVVGDLANVRNVRVFQGETGPHGSIARGEFHYSIDHVAATARPRRDAAPGRGDRGGPDRGPRREKPRGIKSLSPGAKHEAPTNDDRPARGEVPRAGMGWQLTSAPRDFRGGPRAGKGGRGPGGPDRDKRGPRPPRRDFAGPGHGPRVGPDGQPLPPRGPRLGPDGQPLPPRGPRLGPDGQPLPPRGPRVGADGQAMEAKPRRPRKEFGPDANGLGPDGMPWDPERRAKRMAAHAAGAGTTPTMNTESPAAGRPQVPGDAVQQLAAPVAEES